MSKRKERRIWTVLAVVILLAAQIGRAVIVNAEEHSYVTQNGVVDFGEGEASIVIKGNAGQSLAGKTLSVHRLFEAENAKGLESIDYTMNPVYTNALKTVVASRKNMELERVTEFAIIDYMQTLNSDIVEGAQAEQTLEGRYSDYRYFIEELSSELDREGVKGIQVEVADTKSDNSVELSGLAYGYYVVEDRSDAEGKHTAVSMPVVSTANPNAQIHIKADYPTVIKKIQEDDNPTEIGEDGWNDIGDYEIGQDVPYRFRSVIPDINGYHSYYYAWHDNMDEALLLQEDTILITIDGTVGSVHKTYTVTPEEYKLLQNTSEETFVIEINDIKAIVDREFPNTNEKQENRYGQVVTVTYLATLGDKAALDTGRPGFENDVRLEFSNNPNVGAENQTGFTPWDTVVCFTYQLEGLKINNYGMNLSGAVFRLYADEACEEEVLLKKVADRYHVMHPDSWDSTSASKAVEVVSDEDGAFTISGLDGGIYYLKEVTAPSGYRPIEEPIRIEVSPVFPQERNSYLKGEGAGEEILILNATAKIKTFVSGTENEKNVTLETDQEKGSMRLSIVNEIGKKLPITGAFAMPCLFVAGILFMGVALKRGRRKHE